MKPIQFRYRAVNIEHSCRKGNEEEPQHPSELSGFIDSTIKVTEGMEFFGIIKSRVNNYQIDVTDFDHKWIRTLENRGWEMKPFNAHSQLPKIKPDALLKKDNLSIAIEIEKSNEKTVWFDFIKLLMLIGQGLTDYGILVVPRNYAFMTGQWNLFDEARYYRWCLAQFAKVDTKLLSKIAIIGYRQEVYITDKWLSVDQSTVKATKEKAHAHFS